MSCQTPHSCVYDYNTRTIDRKTVSKAPKPHFLTYSPRLKPGDSWIQTAFACDSAGLTMPLQRRSMPPPSRCSLQRSCPDHEWLRNAGISTLVHANLSFPDSARRRYGRFASLHNTDLSFGCSFPFCPPDAREFSQTPQSRSPRSFCPIVSAFPSKRSPLGRGERVRSPCMKASGVGHASRSSRFAVAHPREP